MRSSIGVLVLLGLTVSVGGQTPPEKTPPTPANPNVVVPIYADALYRGIVDQTAAAAAENSTLLNWSKFLGVDLGTVDAPLRAQLKLNEADAYLVLGVNLQSSGEEAGLLVHDVITGLAGEPKADATYPVFVW